MDRQAFTNAAIPLMIFIIYIPAMQGASQFAIVVMALAANIGVRLMEKVIEADENGLTYNPKLRYEHRLVVRQMIMTSR